MSKDNAQFDTKWTSTLKADPSEEFSVFVPYGKKAHTQRQLFLKQYYHMIRRSVGDRPLRRVLEMGCGRGTVSLYFALYGKAHTTLSDLSEAAVTLAKANYAHHGAKGTIVQAPADHTPFSQGEFDLVFSIGLLEHLDSYESIVQEKFRVLKSGGIVASLNIPKKASIQILNTWYRTLLVYVGVPGLKPDYHRNTHTGEQYKAVFERAGFIDCRIVYVTSFPIFTPLPKVLEYGVTLLYRCILGVRSLYKKEPFTAHARTAQAHFIFARKP